MCVYWFELLTQVSDVAHGPLVLKSGFKKTSSWVFIWHWKKYYTPNYIKHHLPCQILPDNSRCHSSATRTIWLSFIYWVFFLQKRVAGYLFCTGRNRHFQISLLVSSATVVFLPALPKAKAGLGVQSLRPSVRPTVRPKILSSQLLWNYWSNYRETWYVDRTSYVVMHISRKFLWELCPLELRKYS